MNQPNLSIFNEQPRAVEISYLTDEQEAIERLR